ncbi:MAG TPA: acetate--CoA ligase family protein [Thermomicrobiaceae bacterium]|nr:acetate--CoA ligase family protein [Thermomicrobiaceae bacterium]
MLDPALKQSMQALLYPQRIGIVGDSPNRGFANTIHTRLVRCGYQGEVVPINPNYPEVMGLQSYPRLSDAPGKIDLAVVAVPSHLIFDVLDDCERAGVGAVDIITSGFAEKEIDDTGGERQQRIRDFAKRTGIRIVGPNCLGNVSVPNRMAAGSGPYPPDMRVGPAALVLQSGLIAWSMFIPLHDRGSGITYLVTLGNEADIDLVDTLRFYVDDEQTQVIGCFVEQFRRPAEFLEVAAEAAERGKPIVVLKVGRTEAARQAARAHTGSLVGSDAVADAVLRQYGVIRVDTLEELVETLAVFHSKKRPGGSGLALTVSSGGTAGLIADMAGKVGVSFPALQPETASRIEAVIPAFGTVGNPLDWTGNVGRQIDVMDECFAALAEDPNIHVIIYAQAFPTIIDMTQGPGAVLKTLPERYPDKVFLVMSSVPGMFKDRTPEIEMGEPATELDGVPFLHGAENGLKAIRNLTRYAAFQRGWQGMPDVAPSPLAERARAMVREGAGSSGHEPLVERAAKAVLSLYGIPVTREKLATTADEAVMAAREIGYPVVLKIESPDITHKTEAGGVLLNLAGDDEVRPGYDRIIAGAEAYRPGASIQGVLVQEYVAPSEGQYELLIGMTSDPDFGPAIVVGMGGIFVEALNDVALAVPPLDPVLASEMISSLRGHALLDGSGARGRAPADLDAVADLLCRFSRLCLDLRDEVASIDINPLLVFPAGQGARVVDCLIVPKSAE